MTRILQITDSHLLKNEKDKFLGLEVSASFKAIITEVKKDLETNKTELVIFSGDVSQDRSIESYQYAAKELATLPCQIAWVPGNHDSMALGEQTLKTCPNFLSDKLFNFNDWQIILLNTHYAGHVSGLLSENELAFLEKNLQSKSPKNKMIMLHHHVMVFGNHWLDKTITKNYDEFLSLIKRYSNIKLVVCGHTHQDVTIEKNGVCFISTPSTSVQFSNSKSFKLEALMPGYRVVNLHDDGRFDTKVIRLKESKKFIPDLTVKGY